jgi:UDP-N-acetyl-D-glucosamine dehydrogenase
VPECELNGHTHASQPLTAELLESAALALIVTAHESIDYAMVVAHAPRVFDTKNATGIRGLAANPKVRRL